MPTKRGEFHGRKTAKNLGRLAFKAYCDYRNTDMASRMYDYMASDLIVDVLHFARSKGWDTDALLASAQMHLHAETVEHCPKCGRAVIREDACADQGEGAEAGRTFYYCSVECRDAH